MMKYHHFSIVVNYYQRTKWLLTISIFFFVGCILLNKNVKVKKTNKQQLQVVHIEKLFTLGLAAHCLFFRSSGGLYQNIQHDHWRSDLQHLCFYFQKEL